MAFSFCALSWCRVTFRERITKLLPPVERLFPVVLDFGSEGDALVFEYPPDSLPDVFVVVVFSGGFGGGLIVLGYPPFGVDDAAPPDDAVPSEGALILLLSALFGVFPELPLALVVFSRGIGGGLMVLGYPPFGVDDAAPPDDAVPSVDALILLLSALFGVFSELPLAVVVFFGGFGGGLMVLGYPPFGVDDAAPPDDAVPSVDALILLLSALF